MNKFRIFRRVLGLILATTLLFADTTAVFAKSNAKIEQVKQVKEKDSISVRGALLWPSQDMELLNVKKEVICKIKAGTPVKALAEANGYFKVYYDKKIGYLESALCMINLPDAMQSQMEYDIVNSYSSIYKIHEDSIPDVTGEVLYPYAMLDDGSFLVPLLYPVAQKLYEAEKDALERGYTLKIYDAYRPYEVTKYIYSKTSQFVEENPIYGKYINEKVKGQKYGQAFFLAKSASNHNYGVALDLTLVNLETDEELKMQSNMHELSPWSVLALNNENADLLSDIMLSNGFEGLVSEWWHFQIKAYRNEIATFQAKPMK